MSSVYCHAVQSSLLKKHTYLLLFNTNLSLGEAFQKETCLQHCKAAIPQQKKMFGRQKTQFISWEEKRHTFFKKPDFRKKILNYNHKNWLFQKQVENETLAK